MNPARPTAALLVPLMAGLTVLGACGASGGDGGWAGTVRDSAGIVIVENGETGAWSDGDRWGIEEELRVGVADGAPEYQFGQVAGIAVDDAGRLYVLDQQAQQVRVYDAEGTYLHSIGRPGSGPGELGPQTMGVLLGPGDTLFVPDMTQQRVQRFLTDGTEAGTFALPFTSGLAMRWERSPNRELVHQLRAFPMPGQDPPAGGADVLLVRGTDGSVRDTVMELPAGESVRFRGGQADITLFAPEPVWTILEDGRYVSGINNAYRFEVRGPGGSLQRIITRPFTRRPVTERDRQMLLDAMRNAFRNSGAPAGAMESMLESATFAEHHPVFANAMGGPAGSLWVQRVQSAEELAETDAAGFDFGDYGAREWEVFDAEGRYLGVVMLPARFTPLEVDGDGIYGFVRDELDVQYVTRLRVIRPVPTAG